MFISTKHERGLMNWDAFLGVPSYKSRVSGTDAFLC